MSHFESCGLPGVAAIAGGERTQPRFRRRFAAGHEGAWPFLGLLVLWQAVSSLAPAHSRYLFPSPAVTATALWQSLPELWAGTWASFWILVPGYLLAVGLGIAAGVTVGASGRLTRLCSPFAKTAAPIPPTVYIPYAIALLPTFLTAAILVVFIGAFWPVFLGAAAGAASVPGRYRDNARVLDMTRFEYLRYVAFPAALPQIFSGMAVSLALSFILLGVAELFGASVGLGRFVQYYADYADYPRVVAGIVYTGLVVLASMGLLEWCKRRALFWNR